MRLRDGDRIVATHCEHCAGPGWSNEIVWVVVQSIGGALRMESIQPSERSFAIATLMDVCATADMSMVLAVKRLAAADGREL